MILAALLLSVPAAPPPLDCTSLDTQAAMNACSHRAFESADAALNVVWNDVRAIAKRRDASMQDEDDQPGYWDTLLKAQRAWLTYRDAHCRFASYDARGGSLQPTLINDCMADLTKARTQRLRGLLVNQVSGEPKTVSES